MTSSAGVDDLRSAIADRYRIERELGAGGMATVYVARDLKHDRDVALKVLRRELTAILGRERFLNEVRLTARLDHPHILTLIDSGESAGYLWYVLPFIRGESLRDRLVREKQLDIGEALTIARQIGGALDYAHRHGIIHRDIKPENILLHEGEAMLADFGIALAVREAGGSRLTETGLSLGTPQYMSPEQATGDRALDARSDVYSLAAVLYEMLTGEPPHTGATVQAVIAKLMTETPTRIRTIRPTVPEEVERATDKALAKVPADRFASAGAFVAALAAAGAATPTVPTLSVAETAASGPRRHHRMRVASGLVSLLALLGAGYWTLGRRPVLDPHRVLARHFVNKTGDAALDPVVVNAAAALNSGLSEIEGVEVVEGAGATAGTIVSGTLYRQGDSIQLSATIADAATGNSYYAVGPVEAPVARPSTAIEPLVQRVVGGVAILLDHSWGVPGARPPRPPRWDAFRQFRLGDVAYYREQTDSAYLLFTRAASLDSTFNLAKLRAANTMVNGGPSYVPRADSLIAAAERLRPDLSPFEAQYLNTLRGWSRGDWETARTAAVEVSRLAPQSGFATFIRGAYANITRRWHESVQVLEKLDPRDESLRIRPSYYFYLTNALHMLGEHRRELEVAQRGRAQFPELLYVRELEIRALAALGRTDELDVRVADVLTLPGNWSRTPGDLLYSAVVEQRAHFGREAAGASLKRLLDWLVTRPEAEARTENIRRLKCNALMLAERWPEARVVADSLSAEHPDDARYLGLRGLIAAHRGDRTAAEDVTRQLAAWPSTGRGYTTYVRAEIAAVLGDSGRAIALLRDALSQGATEVSNDDADQEFENLRGLAEYRSLVAPRD
jgi:tetratricopeptide (TPR) repeat protein